MCWVFVAVQALPRVAASRGDLTAEHRLFSAVAPPVAGHGRVSSGSCSVWAPGHAVPVVHALTPPQLTESSQTRGQTCVPALASAFLSTVPTREALTPF